MYFRFNEYFTGDEDQAERYYAKPNSALGIKLTRAQKVRVSVQRRREMMGCAQTILYELYVEFTRIKGAAGLWDNVDQALRLLQFTKHVSYDYVRCRIHELCMMCGVVRFTLTKHKTWLLQN